MKSLFLLVPLAAFLTACSISTTPAYVSAPAVVSTPAVVATTPLFDSDADGVADAYDRFPYDSRFR